MATSLNYSNPQSKSQNPFQSNILSARPGNPPQPNCQSQDVAELDPEWKSSLMGNLNGVQDLSTL